jgi:hypothetical protein
MCTICSTTLINFGIKHEELDCPLRKSRYCSICARYGHLTKACPDQRKPRLLFIKDNEITIKEFLSKHNITYKKNYRHLLHNYAELNHMRIVYTL